MNKITGLSIHFDKKGNIIELIFATNSPTINSYIEYASTEKRINLLQKIRPKVKLIKKTNGNNYSNKLNMMYIADLDFKGTLKIYAMKLKDRNKKINPKTGFIETDPVCFKFERTPKRIKYKLNNLLNFDVKEVKNE